MTCFLISSGLTILLEISLGHFEIANTCNTTYSCLVTYILILSTDKNVM